jgi:transketolase C-terminal domain/subunit
MKVVVKREIPVEPQIISVTLEMSKQDADILCMVTGLTTTVSEAAHKRIENFSSYVQLPYSVTDTRNVLSNIWNNLCKAGFSDGLN